MLAERVGTAVRGPYQAVFTSPKKRAAQTVAWFLRGAKHQLPQLHGIAEGLAPPEHDRWVRAAGAAGSRRLDAIEAQDPELVAEEAPLLADAVRRLLADTPDGGTALAVGHTPMLEAAVYALTGTAIDPLEECEGVVLVQDGDEIRIEREERLG